MMKQSSVENELAKVRLTKLLQNRLHDKDLVFILVKKIDWQHAKFADLTQLIIELERNPEWMSSIPIDEVFWKNLIEPCCNIFGEADSKSISEYKSY